ncbi:hypothetical protein VQ03_25315 [Methylobacterium tarhaniae]|uniref:Uncharacterized protein n=1 Tax=Methylobacterium tarhaniae TaxID=1187852 RepID=A0A0J6V319_9HYPH|nr:hypothetical protein VQ03_25315 [Methylobacterium tarhaniae]
MTRDLPSRRAVLATLSSAAMAAAGLAVAASTASAAVPNVGPVSAPDGDRLVQEAQAVIVAPRRRRRVCWWRRGRRVCAWR